MADIRNNFDFSGRRVLVTGGAGGIGKAIVEAFAKLNATVIALDSDATLLANLTEKVPSVVAVEGDISNWNQVEEVIKPLLPIHHLINCAAILGFHPLLSIQEEDFDRLFSINTKALLRVTQIFGQGVVDHKLEGATIVNFSSAGTKFVTAGVLLYGATKAAVEYVTKATALELAPYKVRVNAVQPAVVRTPITLQVPRETLQNGFDRQHYHHDFIEPEQVAKLVVYLSSPASEMVTGTVVPIDAGVTL